MDTDTDVSVNSTPVSLQAEHRYEAGAQGRGQTFVDCCDGIPFLDPVTGSLISTQLFLDSLVETFPM